MTILRKVGELALVLVIVTIFTFLLVRLLPGDPAEVIIPFGSDAQRDGLRDDLGLEDPLYSQYGKWLGNFVTGDLGNYYSQSTVRPVADRVNSAIPVSVQLIAYSVVLTLAIAIPAAVYAAYRAGSRFDKMVNSLAFGALAIPNFALGLVLIFFLSLEAGWFPTQGYIAPEDNLGQHIEAMFLPAVSLAVGQIAVYMRLLRSDMIQTLQEDFILMARSKGISNQRVLWRHALRPSSLTLLTVAGLNIGSLIGGAVVIEVIFDLPGLGTLIFESILGRQYVALQSLIAIVAIAYVVINYLIDLLYTILDPRIRSVSASR
jgi:peptide/nickel transport system permease protein